MTTWRDSAACRGKDPDLWFPVALRSDKSARPRAVTRAVTICASCPARARCLEEAAQRDERYGIWGGFDFEDPATRRRIRQSADPTSIEITWMALAYLVTPPARKRRDTSVDKLAMHDSRISRCSCGSQVYGTNACGTCAIAQARLDRIFATLHRHQEAS